MHEYLDKVNDLLVNEIFILEKSVFPFKWSLHHYKDGGGKRTILDNVGASIIAVFLLGFYSGINTNRGL
jgi:hypothetical protein